MIGYEVFVNKNAKGDIQSAFNYYEEKQVGLGEKFLESIQQSIDSLTRNPFFQKRYDAVRCLPMKKFPNMIHFRIEENSVIVYGVINTNLDPGESWLK